MKIFKKEISETVIIILLFFLFLILSYNRLHQWDECFYLYYSSFKFPIGADSPFISAKYGHLFLLKEIIGLTGLGLNGLFYLDLIYALMLFSFVILSFLFLKEIMDSRKDAFYTTIILMFLPLTLFLSFKTLSEVPALLFGSAGLLIFTLGLKNTNKIKSLFLSSISGFLLFLATLSRLDASLMFFSLLLPLIIYKTFNIKKLISSIIITCMTLLFLILLTSALFNINLFALPFNINENFKDPFYHNLYRLIFVGSIFSLFIIISFINYREKCFRFALVWFIAAIVPILLLISYINIRHFYISLIPFSILVLMGIKNLSKKLNILIVDKDSIKIIIIFLFFLILIGNNLYMSKFMENEVDESAYARLFERINGSYGDEDKIFLIPYSFADYSFLKFSFPKEKIFTVENIKDTEKKEFQEFYGNELIGDIDSLKTLNINNRTIFYISAAKSKYNLSWIVKEPQIKLIKVMDEVDFKKNEYEVYLVKLQ